MWDSFIICAISTLSGEDRQSVADDIDGNKNTPKILRFPKNLFVILLLLIIYGILSFLIWCTLKETDFWRAFLVYALPLFFTLITLIGITRLFPKIRSATTRTFQYEEKLIETINKSGKGCVIIVEDIDRTINGERFLESLHVFLQNEKLEQPIIVICPQDTTSFGSLEKSPIGELQSIYNDKLNRSIKIYDDVINSWLPNRISDQSLKKLLSNLGNRDKRFFEIAKTLLDIGNNKSLLSIRALKFIFREIYDMQLRDSTINVYLALICVSSRYISINEMSIDKPLSNVITQMDRGANYKILGNNNYSKKMYDLFLFAINKNVNNWIEKSDKLLISVSFDEIINDEFLVEIDSSTDKKRSINLHTNQAYHEITMRVKIIIDNKYRKIIY